MNVNFTPVLIVSMIYGIGIVKLQIQNKNYY